MYHISNFIKSQWLAVVLTIVFIIYSMSNTAAAAAYREERSIFNKKIDSLESLAMKNKKLIDSLKKVDTLYVQKIKVIKQKEYEEIHIVDSLPASELQGYFTERYPE